MHPLTLKIKRQTEVCFPGFNEHSIEPIVQSWAEERAEWLKKALCAEGYPDVIDQAFQIQPETLKEKIIRIFPKMSFAEAEEIVRVVAEHYGKNNAGSITPKTVHGLCSSSQTEAIYK